MEYIDRLIDVIKSEIRHDHYNKVTAYALKMKKLITGEGVDSLMRRFTPRETPELFEQRKKITQHITKTVANNLIKPMYKIPRSNGAERMLEYAGGDQNKKTIMEKLLNNFSGRKNLDMWMNTRYIQLNNIDPNTFIVLDWKDFDADKELAKPYPLEVSSHEAIDYKYDNDILQYLICKKTYERKENEEYVKYNVYTIYTPDLSIVFSQVTDYELTVQLRQDLTEDYKPIRIGANEYIKFRSDIYEVIRPEPHYLGYVPAFIVGYRDDLATGGVTKVSAIDEAEPILMKMIKANSELDLTMALHAFPQKVQYVKRCIDENCNRGYYNDGTICKTCGGTGLHVSTTAQDAITLEMPTDPTELITLDNIVRYVSPEVSLIRFQSEYIKSLTEQCKSAIYNSEIFSRQEIAETATGKNIDLQNVYDALYPLAQAYSGAWKFIVETIADITDMRAGLVAEYFFPKDFKMKSLSELYLDMKTVADSKADSFIKQNINNDIALYIYQDDSRLLNRYKTMQYFYPFSGKNIDEVSIIVSGNLTPLFNKVLWANYGFIFDEIEMESYYNGEDFYKFSRKRQWEIIKAKTQEIITRLEKKPDIMDYQPEGGDDDVNQE